MDESYQVHPIGVIHSPYPRAKGTPIQSGADETPATVELDAACAEGLSDLDGFERIWLLTWHHQAGPYRLKVTPYMDTVERGLFSTRAPSRPNPIAPALTAMTPNSANPPSRSPSTASDSSSTNIG